MHVLTVDYKTQNAPELFCRSLQETGFAVLTQHPVASHVIEEAYQQWQAFFLLPTKFQFQYQKPSQDGYFPFRTENAKDSKVSDLKEFFHFYPWGKIPEDLRRITQLIYDTLYHLGKELLQWVENYLPQDVARALSMPLNQMIADSRNTLLRILHYPPLVAQREEGAVRAAPHEDINLITLLPTATAPGLEVLDRQGNWHAVTCDPGSIVVNVGDMLQKCTENYYKSTTHRVTNPTLAENASRYSMPFFLHGRDDVLLSKTETYVDCLNQRLKEIGIY